MQKIPFLLPPEVVKKYPDTNSNLKKHPATVHVVQFESSLLEAQPIQLDCIGAVEPEALEIKEIESSKLWRQARLTMILVLSDGHQIDVTEDRDTSYASDDEVVNHL